MTIDTTISTNNNVRAVLQSCHVFSFRQKSKTDFNFVHFNLSNPRVMSMKKKMMAQKKEKGMEAIASLNRMYCEK